MKLKNKKGFTLAELLIVVAIIAVLAAIAVPLFVGSVNRAQKATFDANVQAVKSAVLVSILSDDTFNVDTEFKSGSAKFTATVDKENGAISNIKRAGASEDVTKDYAEWQSKGTITVEITKTDITTIGAAS